MSETEKTFVAADRCAWCGSVEPLDGGSDLCVRCDEELARLATIRRLGELYLAERGIK